MSNLRKRYAPVNYLLEITVQHNKLRRNMELFEIAYKKLDTILKHNDETRIRINTEVKKHAQFILDELDQLNVYYCIENIPLLTSMLTITWTLD
ncbi:MAG: hypothetical protein GY821_04085 [Gammaproteobacteria bacterium]|nr:hypothetical protein [Gammaproteobacteria bacterium]